MDRGDGPLGMGLAAVTKRGSCLHLAEMRHRRCQEPALPPSRLSGVEREPSSSRRLGRPSGHENIHPPVEVFLGWRGRGPLSLDH